MDYTDYINIPVVVKLTEYNFIFSCYFRTIDFNQGYLWELLKKFTDIVSWVLHQTQSESLMSFLKILYIYIY